jgi:hypothetical protein
MLSEQLLAILPAYWRSRLCHPAISRGGVGIFLPCAQALFLMPEQQYILPRRHPCIVAD